MVNNYYKNTSLWFLIAGLLALLFGMFFGLIGSFQYIIPDFIINVLPFFKSRPLHVSLVIAWIFLGAIGSIYYYLPKIFGGKMYSSSLVKIHFVIFILTGIIILYCYYSGIFGGREYFEYPPVLAIPIAVSWIIFIYNFFKTIQGNFKNFPVYVWMWMTGIVFFLFTFIESNLWQIPFFRDNIVRDVSVQWKAFGSMVGSWNMLVYGTAFYIMEKIKSDKEFAHSKTTFFFYFLSLINLMFNWGHHTYIVPASSVIKNVAYIISMTELLILLNIIYNWKKTLSDAQKNFHNFSYRLIISADVWIFLNLILALAISIPAINFYTHGTHITVAHAMGATIGINTTLLLASCYFIFNIQFSKIGFWLFHISLLVFWISLIGAGITKAMEENHPYSINNFYALMAKLSPFFKTISISGTGIFFGISLLIFPLLKIFFAKKSAQTLR